VIRAAVITMSDRSFRKERPEASGPAVAEMLPSLPAEIAQQVVIPDEVSFIRRALLHFCDAKENLAVLLPAIPHAVQKIHGEGGGFAPQDG